MASSSNPSIIPLERLSRPGPPAAATRHEDPSDSVLDYLHESSGVGIDQAFEDDRLRSLARESVRIINREMFPALGKLELFLTWRCPLRCDYCFIANKDDNAGQQMTRETAETAVRFLFDNSGGRRDLSILFFGGEPMARFDLLSHIVVYAKDLARDSNKRVSFDMTTSGVFADEDKLRFLRDHGVSYLLSIDGMPSVHDRHRRLANGEGSWRIVERNLPLFKRYQRWLGTKMTVRPDTAETLLDGVKFLVAAGINQFLIAPAEGIEWTPQSRRTYQRSYTSVLEYIAALRAEGRPVRMNALERLAKPHEGTMAGRWGCRAGRQSFAVTPDGSLYPCSKLVGDAGLQTLSRMGSLADGITNLSLRKRLNDIDVDRTGCSECKRANECSGGCYYNNYLETGDLFGVSRKWECAFVSVSDGVRRQFAASMKGVGNG